MEAEPAQHDQPESFKGAMSNCSSGETTEKGQQSRPVEEPGRVSGVDDDSDQQNHKRRAESSPQGGARSQGDADREKADAEAEDSDTRRQRRRITNRESAKRMRMKRQEELANIQKELKRVKSENEQLRTYSGYLQKQHMFMSTEANHWRTKCTGLEEEVSTLFQQLQQVVAIAAAVNPGILDAVAPPAAPQLPPALAALSASKLLPAGLGSAALNAALGGSAPKLPAGLGASLAGLGRSAADWQRPAGGPLSAPPRSLQQPPRNPSTSSAHGSSARLPGGAPKGVSGTEFRLPAGLHSLADAAARSPVAGEHGQRGTPPPTKILLETQVDLSAVTGIHASS